MHNFRELNVWQKSRILYKDIYLLSKRFPKEEIFGVTSQMRRCAHSIASNIAEGCGRNTNKELCRFLDIANGSAFELESDLILCQDIEFISEDELTILEDKVKEIQRMIYSLKKSKE
ncbi:MAG: four helix bundle protein [Salinivirgaceae bacterium]|nr:four helix bundle protein [Salinivirgaceae bacterium]